MADKKSALRKLKFALALRLQLVAESSDYLRLVADRSGDVAERLKD
jgi:hypothetical protein